MKRALKISGFAIGEMILFFVAFVVWSMIDVADTQSMKGIVPSFGTGHGAWRELPQPKAVVPDTFLLQVPFTAQAPMGDWSQPWQDFCEEATIVMAHQYALGATSTHIALAPARDEMLSIMKFETATFGYNKDTGASEIAKTLTDMYGIPAEAKLVSSPEDIKNELLNYHVVIVPVAGRALGNPYFKPPGPLYHAILIKGYDNTQNIFITNEPGTRFGADYHYDQNILYQALANWDQSQENITSEKMMVVVE